VTKALDIKMVVNIYVLAGVFMVFSFFIPSNTASASEFNTRDNEKQIDLGFAGSVLVPKSWNITEQSDTLVIASDDSTSAGMEITLIATSSKPRYDEVMTRAKEFGLPAKLRKVDRSWLKKGVWDEGSFVHGTVTLATDTRSSDNEIMEHPPTRYWLIAIYSSGNLNTEFILEAWSDDLPDGAMVLHRIQRTWTAPKSK